MSVSSAAIEETRRQLRPIRTELEVAADTLVRLFDVGVLPATPSMIARVAEFVGIPTSALTAARARYDSRGYLIPATHDPAIAHVPDTAGNNGSAAAKFHKRRHGPRLRRGVRSRATYRWHGEVAPAGRRRRPFMKCAKCGDTKHVDEFKHRADRPHQRWTVCNACRSRAQRARYLSARKLQAMNAARVTFVVDDCDDVLALACMDCNRPLHVGDVVYGDASLHHVDCDAPRQVPT